MVLRADVQPGEEQADGNGPRVEQHAGEQSGILVRLDNEEVALDVTCSKDEV